MCIIIVVDNGQVGGLLCIPGPFALCLLEKHWVPIYPPQGTCTLLSPRLRDWWKGQSHHLIRGPRATGLDISDRVGAWEGRRKGVERICVSPSSGFLLVNLQQTQWLKTTQMYYLLVLEVRSLTRCPQGCIPSGPSGGSWGETIPLPFQISRGGLQSLAPFFHLQSQQ